jgi:hypothetical protein
MNPVLTKRITYFGQPAVVGCDARCEKAWGINSRPRVQLSAKNDDDYAYLADPELGWAPADPGTYEGGDGKPSAPCERMNRWCVRECERSDMQDTLDDVSVPDFSRRVYNMPDRH